MKMNKEKCGNCGHIKSRHHELRDKESCSVRFYGSGRYCDCEKFIPISDKIRK